MFSEFSSLHTRALLHTIPEEDSTEHDNHDVSETSESQREAEPATEAGVSTVDDDVRQPNAEEAVSPTETAAIVEQVRTESEAPHAETNDTETSAGQETGMAEDLSSQPIDELNNNVVCNVEEDQLLSGASHHKSPDDSNVSEQSKQVEAREDSLKALSSLLQTKLKRKRSKHKVDEVASAGNVKNGCVFLVTPVVSSCRSNIFYV